jgi:ribosomal protein S18 acetylase RimI-like enzyme
MASLEIRRATEADLPAVAALARELVVQHHQKDPSRFFLPDKVEEGYAWWFRRELARREAVLLVAVNDGALGGYAYGTLEERNFNLLIDRHGAIHDVLVAAGGRRLGTGKRLLATMLEELEALGAPRVLLYTMVDNLAAQALFRRFGFRPTMLEMTRDRDAPPQG